MKRESFEHKDDRGTTQFFLSAETPDLVYVCRSDGGPFSTTKVPIEALLVFADSYRKHNAPASRAVLEAKVTQAGYRLAASLEDLNKSVSPDNLKAYKAATFDLIDAGGDLMLVPKQDRPEPP